MKKERLQVIILVLIIMFGIGYSYFKFLFLPQWTVIQDDTKRLLSLENHYQELLTYEQNQMGLQREIISMQTRVDELNSQLPNRLDKPPIMVGLYTLAKQHTVDPQSMAFEQVQTKGTYQEMEMSFNCLGKMTDLLAMIHDLQFGGSQQLSIKSISLTGSQQAMRAELKLTAFGIVGGSNDLTQKPDFMNASFGVDSPEKLFQP